MTISEQYADDVLNGKILTGELFRLAVERNMTDLDRARRKDFPYYYSQPHADHAIQFIERMRHTKGKLANKRFYLSPHQRWITSVIFGWVGPHQDTGDIVRRYTKFYRENARKEGKTSWLAALGNYLLYGDGEYGAEVYSFATKMDQAKIVFDVARSMSLKYIRDYPILRDKLKVIKSNISYLPTESKFEPLPQGSDKQDGLNAHGGLGDEIHEYDDRDQLDVIETGMGSRLQALLGMITTAGFNIYGPCYKIRSEMVKILRGIITDERSAAFIFGLDPGDSWHDRNMWPKANPNIGITPYWDYMDSQYKKALVSREAEYQFRTKNLSEWLTSGATWLSDDDWMRTGSKGMDLELLKRRPCYVGMDLSTNKDLTVLIALFPPTESDDQYRILCAFFCPEDNIPERSKSDKVNYDIWAEDGYITATPGKVVNYDYLLERLEQWRQMFDIKRLDYDPSFAYQLVDRIERMGIKTFVYGQNTKDMNPPIQEIERLVLRKELDHGQHPILRWNVSNVMLFTDSNGKVKFDKRKVVDRIDGAVALAMAMGGWLSTAPTRKSVYDTEDLFPIFTKT